MSTEQDDTPLCIATLDAIADELGRRFHNALIVCEERISDDDSSFYTHSRGSLAGALGLVRYYEAIQTTDRFRECEER
ncbi:MAG: hypothetical protein RL885_25025 [Planctomycetota bacterium]